MTSRGTSPVAEALTAQRPALLRISWALAGAAVVCQIAYPLIEGDGRDRLTVATVVVTFAAVLCHAVFRLGAGTAAQVFGVVLTVSAGAEGLGVHTGFPFGNYEYGTGLGPGVGGVPLVVPMAWAMMAYPALLVARRLGRELSTNLTVCQDRVLHAVIAGWALASWDVFLDPQMVEEGYWRWVDPEPALPGSPEVPLTNYAGWLVVSVLLMAALDRLVPPDGTDDLLPGALYLWTYGAQVLGNLAFFDRPAVAVLGGLAMGAVALPYARTLRRPP